jgi:cysteinyl-tRNA synthetase
MMKLYNTLSRKVEDFQPIHPAKVQLFVCGPTVYDNAHIGHAKTYIQLDILARVFTVIGYEVYYLQNITDLDDKIIERSRSMQTDWQELRTEFEKEYKKDMATLNNTSVTQYERATDFIPQIINQVQRLIDTGNAYKIDDGIYFEISTFPEYGKLSGRREIKENDAQSRIDLSSDKRGWNDFCLWKFSKLDEPKWEAPFGDGRPGWHIEDTAITEHFFGPQYDIHGGAIDLIFPHHEAELTQMEAASGLTPFVRYWVHTGFLNINNTKMSKSLGNFYTIKEVLDRGYDPMALRLLMLQSHYRSSVNFDWELLKDADRQLNDLRAFADLKWQTKGGIKRRANNFQNIENAIREALENDLNTPQSLAILHKTVNEYEIIYEDERQDFINFLGFLDRIFGLNLSSSSDISNESKQLIDQRQNIRTQQDWVNSDRLRIELYEKHHLTIKDTPYGPIWRRS